MPQWVPKQTTDQIDLLLGLCVGLGVMLFVVTVWLELTGQSALIWALVLLLDVIAVALLWRARRRRKENARRNESRTAR